MTDLTDRVVLLTGASKGIGAATAARLGRAGASLIAHYGRDHAGAEDACAAIPARQKLLLGADLADAGAADDLWRRALAWRGRIDVLVSNAAIMHWHGGFAGEDDAL